MYVRLRLVTLRLPLAGAFVSLAVSGCATSQGALEAAGNKALADATAAACDASIVFLGEEASHGGGRAIRIKTEIARELVQRCGFTHVAFESQIYDFIDLQERYAIGNASREALYDAIGGLWSRAAEIDPLVDLLHEKAVARQLTISGFDGQIGSATAYYTQTALAQRLSAILPTARQELCSAAISRLAGWKFDGANPKNRDFDELLLGCANEIEAIASNNADSDPVQHRLARSFRSFLEFSPTQPGSANDRDRLMYENFEWQIARLPRETKTIVWTATVHGLRKPLDDWQAMANHAVRNMNTAIHSLAVVAASGSYAAAGGELAALAQPEMDSLEGEFSQSAELSYVDSDSLRRVGTTRSRVVSYSRYANAQWGEMLDGVLVLASEAPPTYIRPRTPMQAAAERVDTSR
jgi:erythromycin esterase-like protein